MAQIHSPGATGVEAFGYRQELKRALSLSDLLVYGLVFIAPVAPFSVFGFVFNASNGMVPLVYIVGVVAMLFTALSYMTMSSTFPIAGSVYAYAGRGIGESAGFLAGWAMLLDYLLIPTLAYVGCAVAMSAVLPAIPKPTWVIVFLSFNTGVNLVGIEATAKLNKLLLVPRALAHVDGKRKAPQRAVLLVAAITLVLGLTMISRLELLVSLVNFGALFGFLMLHLSVVIHFIWRGPSRRWLMHLVVPTIGFIVIAYVLVNAETMAQIAGSLWLTTGIIVLLILRMRGQGATLPAGDL